MTDIKQPIEIVRGTTNSFDINLTDADGDAYVLQSGEKLIFGVKLSPCDTEYKLTKTLTSSDYDDGVYVLEISPSDTINLPISDYYYDIGLQRGSDYYMVVGCNVFSLRKNITQMVVT